MKNNETQDELKVRLNILLHQWTVIMNSNNPNKEKHRVKLNKWLMEVQSKLSSDLTTEVLHVS